MTNPINLKVNRTFGHAQTLPGVLRFCHSSPTLECSRKNMMIHPYSDEALGQARSAHQNSHFLQQESLNKKRAIRLDKQKENCMTLPAQQHDPLLTG